MWGSTEKMARAIEDGLAAGGVHVVTIHARRSHRSAVATEILDAGALVVGSPTINNNIFPALADTLTYLKGLKPRGLVGAAFGSYGWSGESVKQVEDFLYEMKVELVREGIKAKYVPDVKALALCRELGEKLSERLQDLPQH